MELRALAERILTAGDLHTKLDAPDSLEDRAPGAVWTDRSPPARPSHLAFGGDRPSFPGNLSSPTSRGRMLHFFANHELLAIELMALMLLRFPDSPRAFRRGLAETLVEEQAHMSRYLGRMAELGVRFGELGVSRFFWDCLASVDTPLQFLAGMSLTLEQANLDYCLQYAAACRAVGDHRTAELLDDVHDDEVGHVAFGLHWFRKWHDEERDWDAWVDALERPLSPARAKGRVFDREGRERAGLDPSFIDELEIWTNSKGRPPRLYWFNPGIERQLANPGGPLAEPVQALRRDLGALPFALASEDDEVLVSRLPTDAWRRATLAAGFALPAFITSPSGDQAELLPFASGPDCVALGGRWTPHHASLFSKRYAATWLRAWAPEQGCPRLGGEEMFGHICEDLEQVDTAMARLTAAGHSAFAVKAELGSSGQDVRRITNDAPQRGWMERMLRRGALIVEGWLDVAVELGAWFEQREDGVHTVGIGRQLSRPGGGYRGTTVGPWLRDTPEAVRRFVLDDGNETGWLTACLTKVASALGLDGVDFAGPFGLDALIYTWEGQLRLKPLGELNPRMTMGRLAHALAPRVRSGRSALWAMVSTREVPDLKIWAAELANAHPPRIVHSPAAQIDRGVLFTNDPESAEHFVGLLLVDKSLELCLGRLPSGSVIRSTGAILDLPPRTPESRERRTHRSPGAGRPRGGDR